jgi:tRNA pseudouridine38-40 synthase
MRIALGVEYDGHEYFGWQAQEGLRTIQQTLETALSSIAESPITIFCAGRTDAGVHATGQVVHFDTAVDRKLHAWVLGTNTRLPPSIAIKWAVETDPTFHARFSARTRKYRYVIYNDKVRPALFASKVSWYYRDLDAHLMQLGANYLLGEHDFSSFRSSRCQSKTPMRTMHAISIQRRGKLITVEIEANAFLHHMVRNIMGVLLKVGTLAQQPHWVKEVLEAKNRQAASDTASASGLYLTAVGYGDSYRFPQADCMLF